MINFRPINTRRLTGFAIIVILLFSSLAVRLFYLTYIMGETYAKSAVAQRRNDMQVKKVRGVIYDRNMLPLTEAESSFSIVVSPDQIKDGTYFGSQLMLHMGASEEEIQKKISGKGPQIFTLNTIDKNFIDTAEQSGAKIISTDKRYSDFGIASHTIGYSPEENDSAAFGLEKSFDSILKGNNLQKIGIIEDARRNPISEVGQSFSTAKEYDGIKLTLDYHIQKAVESVMDENVEKGAVVVVQPQSGDILAIASRPDFSQNDFAKYLEGSQGELINRAITAFDAGSIFKIITASAAIENNFVHDEMYFYCGGLLNIDGRDFPCNDKNGHGYENFEQAFAYSCNIPFYQMGMRMNYSLLHEYSLRFGLGSEVLGYESFGESTGLLPNGEYVSNAKLANMSIGQGDTLLTPLQIASVVLTIVNNGVRVPLNLADSAVDKYGNIKENLRQTESQRAIYVDTAKKIQKMMGDVVELGTGKRAKPDNTSAAGKTSSAETGWMEDGEFKIHAWFAGYTPRENPQYVVCVFIENGRQGSTAAAPVFKQICDRILTLTRQ